MSGITCPHCGTTYRATLKAGARVVCKKCNEGFQVGDEPAALEPEASVPTDAQAGSARRRGAGRSSTARGGRGGRSQSSKPASKTPLFLGIGAVAVVAVVAAVLLMNRGGEGNGASNDPAQQPTAPPKVGAERVAELRAEAARSTGKEQQLALLVQALEATEGSGWESVEAATQARLQLHDQILAVDPDHDRVRRARGESRYRGLDEEWKDKWVSQAQYREIDAAYLVKKAAADKEAAEAAEQARWTKDAWTRRAKRVGEIYQKQMPEGMGLRFVFDRELVQRPYFLMVQDVEIPDPIATADMMGPGLSSLRTEFAKRYEEIIPEWDDKYVVPVLVFKDKESYKEFKKDKPGLPSEDVAAAFYISHSNEPQLYRGLLVVWQGGDEKRFHHSVFHEATHQLMHNATMGPRMGRTPWLQEGIAEFFGSYAGNRHSGYTFGHLLEGRLGTLKKVCRDYWDTEENERDTSSEVPFLTPKRMVGFNRERFERLKAVAEGRGDNITGADKGEAGFWLELVYAEGWAFIHFCYHGEDGKYKAPFEKFLADELRLQASDDSFAKVFGMQSDADWKTLSEEFFAYCYREFK